MQEIFGELNVGLSFRKNKNVMVLAMTFLLREIILNLVEEVSNT
jgi:hypothetical protein